MPEEASRSRAPFIAAIPVALGLAAAGLQLAGGGTEPGVVRTEDPEPVTVLAQLSATDQALVEEHVFGGLPSTRHLAVRQGYVRSYIPEARVPAWVAYHVTPDYRRTPRREGRFSSFRRDPDVDNPVVTRDYVGLLATRGFARGHLAPYGVMGGDRDRDGELAPDDEHDNETVFQANFMTNIAPQHHAAFNGGGGLWFDLERKIQDDWVVAENREVWVFAGCVLGPGDHEKVGPDHDILVPPMFFKIVIRLPTEEEMDEENDLPQILAFLFPHQREQHGELEDYLVTIDVIEALTRLDFFHELNDQVEAILEDTDTILNWPLFAGEGDTDDAES